MEHMRNAAVIGAGIMGSGIAAHLANAGVNVVLLDLDAAVAADGVARQVKSGGFMDPKFAKRVQTGSTVSDIGLISQADWIVEAVAEQIDVKHAIYAAIADVRKPGSIISSNTSTIPLHALLEKCTPEFSADFLITHFFNPPRWMRLLEVIDGPATNPSVTRRIAAFAEEYLGKGIVNCKDTPGFIANRIGTFWMGIALNEAIKLGIDIEEADAALGKPFGIPETGVFGLLDLIGIDLMRAVLISLQQALPATDAFQAINPEPALLSRMIADHRTGRKAGAGFYRLSADRKAREAVDLVSGEYRKQRDSKSVAAALNCAGPRDAMEHAGKAGQLAGRVLRQTLSYAASLVPEIAETPAEVDEAMRLGYAWKDGPFELIDKLGPDWLAKSLAIHHMPVPPLLTQAAREQGFYRAIHGQRSCLAPGRSHQPLRRPDGVIRLSDLKLSTQPVEAKPATNLWDLGDGVACLELTTKMSTLNFTALDDIEHLIERVKHDFCALVIGNDSAVFSAGADLRFFLEAVEAGDHERLRSFIDRGQRTFRALKFSSFPVVAAVAGRALGGGLEIALHCDAIQAHAEFLAGLVETRIGVVPAWGGCKELLLRMSQSPDQPHGPVAPALSAFDVIGAARISASAFDARRIGLLRTEDSITMNVERLLTDAKATALRFSKNYAAPQPRGLIMSGRSGASAIMNALDTADAAGRLSPHDRVIGEKLASVLTGGPSADPTKPVPEDNLFDLEREAFLELVATDATRQRISHMLTTGKPLRN